MAEVEQSPVQITKSSVDELRELSRAQPGTLYAILDACDEPRVPLIVKQLGPERARSLYRGKAEHEYWALAPYLVQVDEQVLDWIVENLWHDPWGIFAVAEIKFAELRKHFRRLLKVEDEDGQELYFRFYDPKVLPAYVETCTAEECAIFFGPMHAFLVSSKDQECIRFDLRVTR